MKRVKPHDLVKPSRPILLDMSGMNREQIKQALVTALKARGFKLTDKKSVS